METGYCVGMLAGHTKNPFAWLVESGLSEVRAIDLIEDSSVAGANVFPIQIDATRAILLFKGDDIWHCWDLRFDEIFESHEAASKLAKKICKKMSKEVRAGHVVKVIRMMQMPEVLVRH